MSKLKIIGWSTLITGFLALVICIVTFQDCQSSGSEFLDSLMKWTVRLSIPVMFIGFLILLFAQIKKST
jgi:hypothetical protein